MSTKKIGLTENIFGMAVRTARKHLKLTQAMFAEPLSITGSYVSDIEKGKAVPSEAVIREIISVYRISRKWLDAGQGEMFTPDPVKDTPAAVAAEPAGDYKSYIKLMMKDPAPGNDNLKLIIAWLWDQYGNDPSSQFNLLEDLKKIYPSMARHLQKKAEDLGAEGAIQRNHTKQAIA